MAALKIKREGDYIHLVDAYNPGSDYVLHVNDLLETQEENCSQQILHLEPKTWANLETLYELAKLTNQLHPNNNIDWYRTFYYVEKGGLLDETFDVIHPDTGEHISTRTMQQIGFNREQSDDTTHQVVDQIVKQRLKEYGLL